MKSKPKYTQSIVTETPIDLNSEAYEYFENTIPDFPNQAVYIYSFKEGKMIYAKGWKEVLGYENEEVNMLLIINSTAPKFANFANELNDKALHFLNSKTENLEQYNFTLELQKIHKNGELIPLFSRVGVYKSSEGKVEQIIGISQVVKTLKFGKVMQYAAYGPNVGEFEETLSKELFHHFAISSKEKEALCLAAKGYAFKEIAEKLEVSQSAIEKRIIPMYKRFNVKSLPHLISFAYDNNILP